MLVAASLDLETRLVTELTVYVLRSRARLCRVRQWLRYGNDDLVRGMATTRAQVISACHPYVYYYCTTALLKMKLRVNENIIIDSIDELCSRGTKKRTETSIKNEIEG